MTWCEVILALRGYENRQLRDWERVRMIAYQVYAGIPKKGQNQTIQKYMPLPSDQRNRAPKDVERLKAQREFFAQKANDN